MMLELETQEIVVLLFVSLCTYPCYRLSTACGILNNALLSVYNCWPLVSSFPLAGNQHSVAQTVKISLDLMWHRLKVPQ